MSSRHLLPHQIRAQALQRQANANNSSLDSDSNSHFVSRKKLYENGRGILGRIPNSIYSFEVNDVSVASEDQDSKSNRLDDQRRGDQFIGSTMLILNDESGNLHLFLDGSVPVGFLNPLKSLGVSKNDWELKETHLVKDEKNQEYINCFFIEKKGGKDDEKDQSEHDHLNIGKGKGKEPPNVSNTKKLKIGNGNLRIKVVTLILPFSSSTASNSAILPTLLPPLLSLTNLSSSMTHLLNHVLDSSLHLSSIFHSTQVTHSFLNPIIEWNKILSEVSIKHASISPLNDLLHLSLTGQINEVSEQLLLHALTEKPLHELEMNIKKSLKFLVDGNRFWLIDGCEKLLGMLERLRGMGRW